jgi:hypothetical protein
VFVAGILKLLGFKAGSSYLLVAIFSPLGAFSLAQRYRQRAVLGYVVAMAVVLGVAVVLK